MLCPSEQTLPTLVHAADTQLPDHVQRWIEACALQLYIAQNPAEFLVHTAQSHGLFYRSEHGLSLFYRPKTKNNSMQIHVDFMQGKAAYLAQKQRAWHHPLAKALGVSRQRSLHVIDATAGLGQDAWVMHLLGCSLTLLERHALAAMLLDDGLQRASQQANIPLLWADAHSWLVEQNSGSCDIVYLDPMFPEKKKSAQTGKGMQAFQNYVGGDHDADTLLPQARRVARQRVVVKRPRLSPYLAQQVPHHSQVGRSTRFDIYMPSSNNS